MGVASGPGKFSWEVGNYVIGENYVVATKRQHISESSSSISAGSSSYSSGVVEKRMVQRIIVEKWAAEQQQCILIQCIC